MPRKKPRFDRPTRVIRRLRVIADELQAQLATPRKTPVTKAEMTARIATWEEAEPLVQARLAQLPPRAASERAAISLRPLQALLADQRKWLAAGLPTRAPMTATEIKRRIELAEVVEVLIRTKHP